MSLLHITLDCFLRKYREGNFSQFTLTACESIAKSGTKTWDTAIASIIADLPFKLLWSKRVLNIKLAVVAIRVSVQIKDALILMRIIN